MLESVSGIKDSWEYILNERSFNQSKIFENEDPKEYEGKFEDTPLSVCWQIMEVRKL